MRRLALVLAALVSCARALSADQKPANPPGAVRAGEAPSLAGTWTSHGSTWNRSAFNRSVQVDAVGKTALRAKGRFSLEVVATGEKGDVLLRFFDSTGAPLAEAPGHVRGIDRAEAARTGKPAASGQWSGQQKWPDAGFDAASPFSSKAMADGSVRVELRSSKFQGLFIEATLPAVQTRTR